MSPKQRVTQGSVLDRVQLVARWLLLSCALVVCAPTPVAAQSKRFTEIEYDESGRVKAMRTAVEESAPVIVSMTPNIVRHGPPTSVEVRGSSLRAATVRADHPNLVVSALTSTANLVTFRLQADASVPLGPHRLTLATALGETFVEFDVFPRLPVLMVEPNPAVLSSGETMSLRLRTDVPDVVAHTFQLAGTGGLSVSPATLTLPAGETLAGTALLHALGNGVGSVRVESVEVADVAVPVFVTPRWQPVAGSKFYSALLGVKVGDGIAPPQLVPRGPFVSLLGVVMPGVGGGTTNSASLNAPLLGLSVGAVATDIQPDVVVRGSAAVTLEVRGHGLNAVQSVALVPSSGVTATLQSKDGDGRRLALQIGADAAAALGARELVLLSAQGTPIPFVNRAAANVRIVDPQPGIDSVAPLILVRGATTTVTVRGTRLQGASALRLTPADGVSIGSTLTLAPDGAALSASVSVAPDAALGERAVSLVSSAGETSTELADHNRVRIVSSVVGTVTPVTSPVLGVSVGFSEPGTTQSVLGVSPRVGVVVGSSFTGLQPAAKSVGSAFVLRLDGHGLATVNGLAFDPSSGMAVSNVVASADGTHVTADISIASNAPRGVRRVVMSNPSGSIAPVSPSTALFRVTELLPEIESVAPLVVVPGSAAVTLRVRGRNLLDVTGLRLEPSDGASVSALAVAPDGRSLTASLNTAAAASLGPRVVVLDTPTGSSDASASAANTVVFASSIVGTYSPLLSPIVGVQVGDTGQEGGTELGLLSALLGVQVGPVAQAPSQTHFLAGARLGVAVGPVAHAVSPEYLAAGRAAELRVEGRMLAGVTGIELLPPDGVVLTGPLQVAASADSITVPIDVAPAAAQTERLVIVRTAQSTVPFAAPRSALTRVVGNEPRIDSIAPIQATPGQTLTLTIRGGSLFGTTAVTATPSQGLTFGVNPIVSSDGSTVTVSMTIAPDAPRGPRVIRVVASGGTTTNEALAANTFTVVTQ